MIVGAGRAMNISQLGTQSDGTRSFEIRAGTLSYRALIRCIRRIPGAIVTDAAHHPMTDDTKISLRYKDITITIETPFSDYIINCTSSSGAFEEFISKLNEYPVRWWDRFI
jgi:hypothetical protein